MYENHKGGAQISSMRLGEDQQRGLTLRITLREKDEVFILVAISNRCEAEDQFSQAGRVVWTTILPLSGSGVGLVSRSRSSAVDSASARARHHGYRITPVSPPSIQTPLHGIWDKEKQEIFRCLRVLSVCQKPKGFMKPLAKILACKLTPVFPLWPCSTHCIKIVVGSCQAFCFNRDYAFIHQN